MRFVISNSIIALASLLILGLALIGNPFAGPSLSNTAFAAFDFFNANFGVCPTCSNNVCPVSPPGSAGPDCLSPGGGSVKIADPQKLAEGINGFIDSTGIDSPYKGMGSDFIQAGGQAGINPLILIGEAMTESSLGTAIPCPEGHNAFGREATSSQPNCAVVSSNGNLTPWYIYDSWKDSLYGQAQYVYDVYVNPNGSCPECKNSPLSFEAYLNKYSPASDGNDHAAMTKTYEQPLQYINDHGYGSSIICNPVAGTQ